jgi:hypothetical protein
MYALGKALNRDDCFTIRAFGGIDARDHRLTIHKDSTRAALGFFATNLCARQAQSLAEKSRKRFAWFGLKIVFDTVNCKGDLIIHKLPL